MICCQHARLGRICLPILPLLISAALLGAEPAASEPLRYRRIYIPTEDLASEARGMIPLKREEFERRVSAWSARRPGAAASHVRVERAVYSARLAQNQWVGGNARLDVVAATSEPAVLAWDNCNLALGTPLWDEQPPRPARMGTSPESKAILLVERSGSLLVPWSLRGELGDAGVATFNVRLPKATMNRLVLQIPSTQTLSSDGGLVSQLSAEAVENALLPPIKSGESANWLVELGGQTQTRLRLGLAAASARREGVVLVRETATHVLSPVDVSSEFALQLDIHQTRLSTLRLAVDEAARVTGVRLGGMPLAWLEVTPAGSPETALQIDLPDSLAGSGNSLSVSVVSPLPLERDWRLPRLRLQESTWQEGTVTLVLPASLRVREIGLAEARQTSLSPGTTTQPEQTYQFQYHSPRGEVRIQAARVRPQLKVLGGLVVRHEGAQLSALLNMDLAVDSGERFDLDGLSHEDWVIDSVDTTPSDLLEERQYLPGDGRTFGLRLRLARPLTAAGKMRLVVRAHRQLPAEGEALTSADLQVIRFQDVREERTLVALRAAAGSREFQLSGDLDLFRIEPESAGPEELGLLESSPAGILFRIDRQAEGAGISLVPSDPRFTASVVCTARILTGKIQHQAIASITPTSSSLSRLLVRCSGPVPVAMRWQLVGTSETSIASQTLLPAGAPLDSDGDKESVWELLLSGITTQPLKLQAIWETPLSPRETLPLFSFPEAASQDGLLRVEAEHGFPLRLEAQGVKPIPPPLARAGEYSQVRGMFRYDPGRRGSVSLSPQPKDESLTAAWANRCTLLTRYAPDGSASHEITWQLENHGLDRFPFSLPPGARLKQAFVDGEAAPFPVGDAGAARRFISLPSLRRNPKVTLAITTMPPAGPGVFPHALWAPLVTTPLPVLDRSWRVTLPPELRRLENTTEPARTSNLYALWKSRMWGAFLASTDSQKAEEIECAWSENEPLVLWVYSPARIRIGGFALAIAAASLLLWSSPRRSVVAIVAAASAATAILLPVAFAPLAAGLFWGTLVGGLIDLVRPRSGAPLLAPRHSSPSTQTMMGASLTGALILAPSIFLAGIPAIAAPGDAPRTAPADATGGRIHRVVVPIDADQRPVGEYVYVPLDFYTLLYRAPEREELPPWLVRSAAYEFATTPENPSSGNFTLRLEIESLAANAKVSLPLHRGEIHLLEGRAMLDGEPIPLDWDEAGTFLRFGIERPGIYQLELGFSAAAKMENGAASWNVAIPQAARAALRIKSVSRPGDWLIPGALGAAAPEGDDLLVELGPTAALSISRGNPEQLAAVRAEAEQLVWWKLRPGSVAADMLVRIRPEGGMLREIKVLADPRLRLLPLENDPRFSRVWVEEGEFNTHHFTLAEPAAETVELRGRFLLLDSSGIGKFLLPRLEVVVDRRTKHWQAITVSNEIEIAQDSEPPLKLVVPVDFVDSWGGAARPPNLAFDAAGTLPSFLVRPQEGAVAAKETIDVSVGRKDAVVIYRADLKGIPQDRFQEVIDLPAGFRVRQAAILEQDVNVSLPAPAESPRVLTVERGRSPAAGQQLVIEGTLPLKSLPGQPEKLVLPSLRAAASEGATIRLYRTSAALLGIKKISGLSAASAPEGPLWDQRLGRLVASYKSPPALRPASRELELEVKSNEPAAVYRLVTTMERTTSRSWSAAVQCAVTVEKGELDSIRLEIPAEWSGPFELTPPMDHQVVLLPGQTQRHLIIRPTSTDAVPRSISIRGPLKLQPGETPHAPVLLPLDAKRTESFLVLPTRVDEENLQWQPSGLQALSPGEARDANLTAPAREVFRVVAPRFVAALLQSKDLRKSARIASADFLVRPALRGGYWAQASYYLIPGSRGEADVQLPAAARLVQVLVNESPADSRRQPDGAWRIRLAHEQLPQKVQLIYECASADEAADSWQFSPPRWLGIATERATWSVLQSQAQSWPVAVAPPAPDPRQVALKQMSTIIRLLRDASDSGISGLPASQLADWLSLWRLEFARSSEAAQAKADLDPQAANDPVEVHRRALEAEFAATLSRYADLLRASTPPVPPVASEYPSDVPAIRVIQSGEPSPLELLPPPPPRAFLPRLGLAVCLLALVLISTFVVYATPLGESLALTPAYTVALAAVLLLFLAPVGWLVAATLIAASAWFSLRGTWPGGRADNGPGSQRFGLHSRQNSSTA